MIEIFDNIDALVEKAARTVVESAEKSVRERGRFVLALSGGHTPVPLYRLLAKEPWRGKVPWKKTFVFWSDERYVPLDDRRSNAKSALEVLLNKVPVPRDLIFPLYIDGVGPEAAAKRYQVSLTNIFESGLPRLDLTLLGCGNDGHTASLFPGSEILNDNDLLVRAVLDSDIPRVTMTPRLINQSRQILFLAFGRGKSTAVKKVLADTGDPREYPARLIRPENGKVLWLLDKEAASDLSEE